MDNSNNDDIFNQFGEGDTKGTEMVWKRHSLQSPKFGEPPSTFVARIVPPIKSQKTNKRGWAVYHEEYYGYDGRSKKSKDATRCRPFEVQGKPDKTMNPAFKRREKVQADMKQLEAKLLNSKTDPELIKVQLKPYSDWLMQHNRKAGWHINVMDQNGGLIVLQLSNRTKKALEAEIDRLSAQEGVSAMDPRTGVWFEFTRTRVGPQQTEVNDTIRVLTETVTLDRGVKAQVTKSAPMTQEQAVFVLANAPDLNTDTVRVLSVDQVEAIVTGPEDPDFVDSVWNNTYKAGNVQLPENEVDGNSVNSDSFFKDVGL